jgi:hypothetical protein
MKIVAAAFTAAKYARKLHSDLKVAAANIVSRQALRQASKRGPIAILVT